MSKRNRCELCFCRGCEFQGIKRKSKDYNNIYNWLGVAFIVALLVYAINF